MLGTGVQVVLTMAGCLAGAGVVDRVGGRISKALLANPLSLFTAYTSCSCWSRRPSSTATSLS